MKLPSWFGNLFTEEAPDQRLEAKPLAVPPAPKPAIHDEYIPGAFSLGLYYSDRKDEIQVAKLAPEDRATHLYVIGATGTGKTKFLECLIRQDIEAGHGCGVIDPHGDLIEDLKGYLAYLYYDGWSKEAVSERIILVDPTDPNYTVTFNPLERIPGVSVAEQAGELLGAFRKIWTDSWGVRMEDLLRNSLIALGEAGLTLVDLPTFLTYRPFRQRVLTQVSNPTAQEYFHRFDSMTDKGQNPWIEPVMNKVNAFLADERIRLMFSSPTSSFRIREIMDQQKCLLIKLDKGKLKDAADLLGSLFMALIQMGAFSRSNIPQNQRVPFYLYIDEFQNFATESFKVVLSESRKYGLSLTMAHQSLSQIPDDLRGQILGSAGLQVYFRVNRSDAQLLAKEAFSYSGYEVKSVARSRLVYWSFAEEWEHKIEELQNLAPRQCYAKHKIAGGIIALNTIRIPSAAELLGMDASEAAQFTSSVPFGRKYLRAKTELMNESKERQRAQEEPDRQVAMTEIQQAPVSIRPLVENPRVLSNKELAPVRSIERKARKLPDDNQTVEREHRRLQHLIKRMAEQYGYKATIEEPTIDGKGRVDVGLERDGKKVACEISVTSTPEQELGNIQKCLASGYEKVIVCSSEPKTLNKIQSFVTANLSAFDQQNLVYIEPEGLPRYFEEEAADRASKEVSIKGYKVKVNYRLVDEAVKDIKRNSLVKVLLQSSTHKD